MGCEGGREAASYLEVDERDGDEGGDDEEHDEGQEEDAEERVDLVAPDGVEDVVQLDVDGAEGQEAGHEQLRHRVTEARHVLRDLMRTNKHHTPRHQGRG